MKMRNENEAPRNRRREPNDLGLPRGGIALSSEGAVCELGRDSRGVAFFGGDARRVDRAKWGILLLEMPSYCRLPRRMPLWAVVGRRGGGEGGGTWEELTKMAEPASNSCDR